MKILCPLYPWVGDTVELDQAVDGLRRGDIAVVNGPKSGPPDASEAIELRPIVERLQRNGVHVLGYVPTAFGNRPLNNCLDGAIAWRILVGVDGVFWDEVDPAMSFTAFKALHGSPRSWAADERHGRPRGISAFNPGKWDESMIELMRRLPESIWVTFEGPASAYEGERPVTHRYPSRECHVIYAAGNAHVISPQLLGYRYVTSDDMPNPWDSFDEVRQPPVSR